MRRDFDTAVAVLAGACPRLAATHGASSHCFCQERRLRVRELAGKAIGRYRNALVASCFLPWAAVAARANDHRRRQLRWLGVYFAEHTSDVAKC